MILIGNHIKKIVISFLKQVLIIALIILLPLILLTAFVKEIFNQDSTWDDKESGKPSSYTNNVGISESEGIVIDKEKIVKEELLKRGYTEDEINNMTEEFIIDIFDMVDKLGRNIKSLNDCTQAEILWCLSDEYSKYLEKPEQLEYLLNAELITQYPKIKGLSSDKLNGLIEFERFTTDENTNKETTKKLEYISIPEFDKKFNEYTTNGNNDIFNYFTIDVDENVIVATWTREDGYFESNNTAIQTQKKIQEGYTEEKIKEKYDQRYTVETAAADLITAKYTTYRIEKAKINYKSMIQQYTMPFEYLWIFLVMGKEYGFVEELAKLAYDSEIVIGIYDDITSTVEVNRKEYTENFREKYEYYEDFKIVPYRSTDWSEDAYNYYEENKITVKYNTVQLNISYANTWIVEEKVEYINIYSLTYPYNQNTNDPDEDWSDNGSETKTGTEKRTRIKKQTNSQNQIEYITEEYDVYIVEKYHREKKTTGKTNTTSTEIDYNKYQKSTSTIREKTELDDTAGPNFVNLIRKEENINAYRLITDKKVTAWLVEALEKNESTVNMVDLTLYLLNKATETSDYLNNTNITFDDIWEDIIISNTPITAVGEDYIVDTTKSRKELVITDVNVLRKAVEGFFKNEAAKKNILSNLDAYMEIQNTYNVNAVFAIAVAQMESNCGTNWNLIDESTHNMYSIKGSYNGNSYVDSRGTHWCSYPSFKENILEFGDLIANDSTYYFQAGNYTVSAISVHYCETPDPWRETIISIMTKMYSSVGITTLGSEGDLTITGGIGGTENNESGSDYPSTFTVGQRTYKNYKQPRGTDWCGITSTAIVLSGYGFNITQQEVHDQCLRDGKYYWRTVLGNYLGCSAEYVSIENVSRSDMRLGIINQLKEGKPVIVHVPKNDGKYYTDEGHYFVILAISEDGQQFYVSDPGGYSASKGRDGWNNISEVLEHVDQYVKL